MASGLINRSNKIYFRTRALSRCVGRTLVGNTVKNKRILFYSDNESVEHVINKQTSKHIGLLALVRQLVLICLSQNIYFRARHVSGRHNVLADSLSHLQGERFLSESNRDDSVYLNYLNVLEFVNTATLTKLRTKIISYFIVIAIKLLDNK